MNMLSKNTRPTRLQAWVPTWMKKATEDLAYRRRENVSELVRDLLEAELLADALNPAARHGKAPKR